MLGKPERKRPLGRPWCQWESIKIDFKETAWNFWRLLSLVLTMVNVNHKEVDTGDTALHFLQYDISVIGDEGKFLLMGLDCKR